MNLSQSFFSSDMVVMDNDLSFVGQFQSLQSFEQELAAVLGEDVHYSSSSPENSSPPSNFTGGHLAEDDRPSKQHKIHHHHPNADDNNATIFSNCMNNNNNNNNSNASHLSPEKSQVPAGEQAAEATKKTKKGGRGRPPSHTYDHIMAERKRRELLSRQFLALSTIVPDLRKMDKTSVLGDTIKYLKQIQERVKTLEEESSKRSMESMVFVKKSHELFKDDDDEISSDENGKLSGEQPLPEIEMRVCDKHVLLRIYCEKQKGVLGKIFSEVDKLNLSIINSSVASFGSLALDVTIIVEKEKEFDLSVNHIVKSFRSAIQRIAQTP